ncbi:MAG: stage II sporulation protein P [Oscillospiraceae bacterium]|nr:stage II sporulation protein P [Oscillospiraceae bacterium]
MDLEKQSLRIGATVILCALVLRLAAGGLFTPAVRLFSQPNIVSLLIYLETGRIVRFSDSSGDTTVFVPAAVTETEPEETEPPARPTFTAEEGLAVDIRGEELAEDAGDLIQRPLDWDLTGEEPTVLIYHTHATESYTPQPGERYQESSPYRTLSDQYNMVSIGDRVAELLEAGGVKVIHDRELHDYPNYNTSYNSSRSNVQSYLAQYPSIKLVLDIHRDASGDNNNQMTTYVSVDGEPSAQIMLVMAQGTNSRPVPRWRENLSLGLKLHTQLERTNPGITRYVNLRASRFNQDLSAGAILVEVGAAGDTHEKAMRAAEELAEAILALKDGAN